MCVCVCMCVSVCVWNDLMKYNFDLVLVNKSWIMSPKENKDDNIHTSITKFLKEEH